MMGWFADDMFWIYRPIYYREYITNSPKIKLLIPALPPMSALASISRLHCLYYYCEVFVGVGNVYLGERIHQLNIDCMSVAISGPASEETLCFSDAGFWAEEN